MLKDNENCSTKELVTFLNASNEALRQENLRLMDEIERLTNNIEVHDAEIISNYGPKINYIYNFKS